MGVFEGPETDGFNITLVWLGKHLRPNAPQPSETVSQSWTYRVAEAGHIRQVTSKGGLCPSRRRARGSVAAAGHVDDQPSRLAAGRQPCRVQLPAAPVRPDAQVTQVVAGVGHLDRQEHRPAGGNSVACQVAGSDGDVAGDVVGDGIGWAPAVRAGAGDDAVAFGARLALRRPCGANRGCAGAAAQKQQAQGCGHGRDGKALMVPPPFRQISRKNGASGCSATGRPLAPSNRQR